MERDIDAIEELVKQKVPSVVLVQMHKKHAADDDGLWWFKIPGIVKNIQIESSSGNCPFMVESDDDKSSADARTANSVQEAVDMITIYLGNIIAERR